MPPSVETAPATDPLSKAVPHPARVMLFDWRATLVDTMDAMEQRLAEPDISRHAPPPAPPDAVVDDFDELLELVAMSIKSD